MTRRTRMRRGARLAWMLAAMWMAASAAAVMFALAAPGATTGAGDGVLGPDTATVTIDINNSKFAPTRLTVLQHTTVTFRIVNHDPIGHEFIVGDAAVHELHEAGTHGQHGTVPGEVSVAPGEVATTKYTFHTPGVVAFACHLPGHLSYGMVGEMVVKPAPAP